MNYLLPLLVTLQAWRPHISFLSPSKTRKSIIHLQEDKNTAQSTKPTGRAFWGADWSCLRLIFPSCSPNQP